MYKNVLCVTALAGMLFSCSMEDEITPSIEKSNLSTRSIESLGYSVIDGCLHFDNMEAYSSYSEQLNALSDEELTNWSKRQGYNSLFESYANLDSSLVIEDSSVDEKRMSSRIDATLFNADGFLCIADTVYKVLDEYVYKINKDELSLLEDIRQNPDNYKNIRYKHTKYMQNNISTLSSVSDGERSYMIQVNSKRREYVKFFVSKSMKANGLLVINIKMQGQAQKKGPLGRWKLPFDDELVWGQIVCDGAQINGKNPFPGVTSNKGTNVKTISAPELPLTASNLIDVIKVHVIFNFCKNTVKGDESYTHEYVLQN